MLRWDIRLLTWPILLKGGFLSLKKRRPIVDGDALLRQYRKKEQCLEGLRRRRHRHFALREGLVPIRYGSTVVKTKEQTYNPG